jgi:hypothetical protein
LTEPTKVVHVNTWAEFKQLAMALRPEFIAYDVEDVPLSRPPIGLRLVFATQSAQYVFLDFAHGASFARTNLPVNTHKNGGFYLKVEDLKNFLYTELNRQDISIVSFGVL